MAAPTSWPPLVVGDVRSPWIRLRDAAITVLAWLALAILLNRELELGLASWLDGLGLHAVTDLLGLAGIDRAIGWSKFGVALGPYVVVFGILFAFLLTFALHTIIRRRRALRAPHPPPLGLSVEARGAGLGSSGAEKLGSIEARPQPRAIAPPDDEVVDGRSLLTILSDQDEKALVGLRQQRITTVEIRPGGSYVIHAGTVDGPIE